MPFPKQILTGLPDEGLVVETDDPDFSFGDDTLVVAVDACSGLEVPVVSETRFLLKSSEQSKCRLFFFFKRGKRSTGILLVSGLSRLVCRWCGRAAGGHGMLAEEEPKAEKHKGV